MSRAAPSLIAQKGAEVAKAKYVVVEELRLTIRMPATTADRRVRAAVRTLAQKDVTARMRRAVRDVIIRFPIFDGCRISLRQ